MRTLIIAMLPVLLSACNSVPATTDTPETSSNIERYLALEEIKQLKARYFRYLDTKNWSGMESLITMMSQSIIEVISLK